MLRSGLGLCLLWLALALVAGGCDRKDGGGDDSADDGTETESREDTDEDESPEDEGAGDEGDSSGPGLPPSAFRQYSRAEVEKSIAGLKSGDERSRGMALMSVPSHPGHFREKPALLTDLVIPALLEIAQSGDSAQTRGTALSKICGMGPHAASAVPALVALLDDDVARQFVAFEVHKIGEPARPAMDKLAELLGHSDKAARIQAADGLGLFGPAAAEAVGALVKALESDADAFVRLKAAHALGKIGPAAKEALPALDEAARNGQGNVRWAAGQAAKAVRGE